MRSCLIVDASADARGDVAAAIRAAQKGVLDFHEAADATDALALFTRHAPDVVFVDMTMSAAMLAPMLHARPDAHVVVLAGAREGGVPEAISAGALAALRKPIKAEDVQYVLDAIEPERPQMDYFG